MKILVTGGAGFVGSHLVDELTKKHEVIIYDNIEPQVHKNVPEYLNNGAEFIREDIRDRAKLKGAVSDSEIIFHEAAMVGVGQSMYQIEKYMDVNTMSLMELLEYLEEITGWRSEISYDDYRPSDQKVYISDFSSACFNLKKTAPSFRRCIACAPAAQGEALLFASLSAGCFC